MQVRDEERLTLQAELMEKFARLTPKQKRKVLAFAELLREEEGEPHAGA